MRHILKKFALRMTGIRIHMTTTLVRPHSISFGRRCIIEPFCFLKTEENGGKLILGDSTIVKRYSHISAKNCTITIGNHSYIGYNNWIGGRGDISIGFNFASGMNVVIISSNHDYRNIVVPYHSGNEVSAIITIGSNVWIGANSVIVPGVSIGSGAVIGAGSVVVKDIPENAKAAGNPATILEMINRPSSDQQRVDTQAF